jgi:hypothetical protein
MDQMAAFVDAGLPKILERKTQESFRDFELAVWAHAAPDAPPGDESRPAMVQERFDRARDQVIEAIDFAAGLQRDE